MISLVNGYVCTSSCDVARAKQGKDPSAPPGSPQGVSGKDDKTSAFGGQPVTMLDGSYKDFAGTNTVNAIDSTQRQRLDRMA